MTENQGQNEHDVVAGTDSRRNATKGGGSDDTEVIAVDIYGIQVKAPSHSADLGEELPTSWTEVRKQISRHLMRIAAGATRVVADMLEGASRLIRGITRLPHSVGRRLELAHDLAENEEEAKQIEGTSVSADDALAQAEAILEKYRTVGVPAYIVIEQDGKIYVVIGTGAQASRAILRAVDRQLLETENPLEDAEEFFLPPSLGE